MAKLQIVVVSLVLLCSNSNFAHSGFLMESNESSTSKPEPGPELKLLLLYSCYDLYNNGYKGDIPHPTNCSKFLQCVDDGGGRAVPITFLCPSQTYFSLEFCRCEIREMVVCFDYYNGEHEAQRFKCADRI